MAYSIDYINTICTDLGGTGGHTYEIDGLNEICTLLSATAGHTYNIDALNAICTALGYTAGWTYDIEALNTIVVGGTYKYEVHAWADIQQGSLLKLLAPTNLVATPVSGTRVDLTFTVNSPAQDGTRIYISTDNGTTWTEKGTSAGTTYSATDLTIYNQYTFKAVSYKSTRESDASSNASAYTADFANIKTVGTNLFDKTQVQTGKELKATGEIGNEANSITSPMIELSQEQILITLSGLTPYTGSYANLVCWYDVSHTFIAYATFANSLTEFSFVIPLTAKYFCWSITRRKSGSETINLDTIQAQYYGKSTYEAYSSTTESVQVYSDGKPVFRYLSGKNKFNKNKYYVNCEVKIDGAISVYGTGSQCSGYINVPTDAKFVYLSGFTAYTGTNRVVAFYNSSHVFISYAIFDKSFITIACAVPDNTAYVVFDIIFRQTGGETINYDTIQCEFYSETSFEAYAETWGNRYLAPVQDTEAYGMTLLAGGDSIMETCGDWSTDGATYTEGTRQNWLLFATGLLKLGKLRNYAASGGGWIDVAQNTRLKATTQVATMIDYNATADIIVINSGVNDGHPVVANLGDFATAMGKATLNDLDDANLYEALRWCMWSIRNAYPTAKCFVGNVLPNSSYANSVYANTNTAIQLMAAEYNFIYVDQYGESGFSHATDTSDGLHPNHSGWLKLASYWTGIINANI